MLGKLSKFNGVYFGSFVGILGSLFLFQEQWQIVAGIIVITSTSGQFLFNKFSKT